MIKKLLAISLIGIMIMASACKKDQDTPEEWVRGSDFEGSPRNGATSFMIADKLYLTGGFDGEKRLTDLWVYDAAHTNWYKIDAEFPGAARSNAVSFVVNGKAYVGSGWDGTNSLSDFYEFNPETKSWRKVADLTGDPRYSAIAFSGNGKGFVGTGTKSTTGGDLKDFFSYDPLTDQWTQVKSIPGSKRANAFTFTLGETVYVGSGSNNSSNLSDFWSYDTKNDIWTQKNELNRDAKIEDNKKYHYNISRASPSTFTIGRKAYMVGGRSGGITVSTWAYDPSIDLWEQHKDLNAVAREEAIGFSVGGKGYITTGRNAGNRFDDLLVFTPNK